MLLFAIREYCSSQAHIVKAVERDITKRIKQLHGKAIHPKSDRHQKHIINNEVLSIYNDLEKQFKTNYVINTFLKYCLDTNSLSQILDISEDIINTKDISPLLLLNCCKKLVKMNNSETIKIINHIRRTIDEEDNYSIDDIIKVKNSLINFYSICNDLENALSVLDSIPMHKRDSFTLSSMMQVYISCHKNEDAVELYEQNRAKHSVTDVSRILYIKALLNLKKYDVIRQFMESEIKDLNEHSIELSNTLIDYHGQIGEIDEAWNIFNFLQRNVFTIGVMMKALINNQQNNKAIELFEGCGLSSNDTLKLLFIQACVNMNDNEKCLKFIDSNIKHAENHSIELINTLIDFYGKIGAVEHAIGLFQSIANYKKDVVTIGSIMKSLINNDQNERAISIFEAHKDAQNDTSKLLFIKACSNSGKYEKCHSFILNESDNPHKIEYYTTVIDFYGEFGDVQRSWNVFENIPNGKRNAVSINSMLKCLVNNDEGQRAIELYEQCEEHDDTTQLMFIKACMSTRNYHKCKSLITSVSHERSIQFLTTAIDWHGKVGNIEDAKSLFNSISDTQKDAHLIGAMMNAYNNNEKYQEALNLFACVKDDAIIQLHAVCYITALHCCGSLISEHQGSAIIAELQNEENVDILKDLQVQSAIISFHAKCGQFERAITVFDSLQMDKLMSAKTKRSKKENNGMLFVFAAILDCYAKMGNVQQVLSLFHKLDGKEVSTGIYCIVLNACSQTGLVDEALNIFGRIKNKNNGNFAGIHPHVVTAMIDCLGRSGHLNEAENMYTSFCKQNDCIFYKSRITMLLSIFSSCVNHDDTKRAKRIVHSIECIQNDNNCDNISISTLLSRIASRDNRS